MIEKIQRILADQIDELKTENEKRKVRLQIAEDEVRRKTDQLRIARETIDKLENFSDELENYAKQLQEQINELVSLMSKYKPGFDITRLKAPEYQEEG